MTKLKVAVRVRPLSRREVEAGSVSVISVENGDTLAITNVKVPEQNAGDSRERVRRFTFDYCFQEDATQEMVFSAIESVIGPSLKQRFHSCVLAYGQSSTGKTHTMMGFPDDPGLTPLLCEKVFSYFQESAVGDEINNMKVTVSYLEIYNEKVKDLLDDKEKVPNNGRKPLKVREHPKKGPYVQGLSEHSVSDSKDLLEWLENGNRRRRVASTLSNPESSRSHAVFSVNCEGVRLNLIDLAGSERASNRCFNLSRFKEGANINKSLVALGNVISALADQTFKQSKGIRRKFVPYRDSVLTWLLKDTLGGNSNTFVVATVSPSSACYNETVNTLRFGQRAKLIVSRPVVNEDPKEKTIRELRAEIVRLKDLLKGLQFPMNSINDVSGTEKDTFHTNETKYTHSNIIIENVLDLPVPPPQLTEKQNIDSTSTTEKLLPLIEVNSIVKKNKITQLRRTFSVDHSILKSDRYSSAMYSSNDSLPSTSTKSTPPSEKDFSTSSPKSRNSIPPSQAQLRRRSLTKNVPPLPKPVQRRTVETSKKIEKAVSTENLQLKNVEAKVQSIRKNPTPHRSQIVAAVTSRLYSKLKKREVATDTHDFGAYQENQENVPKELNICSNARLQLRELTKRALKAHRNKHEETQTESLPVKILKERSTDVDDLLLIMEKVKEVGTMSEAVETKEVAIECSFFKDFFGEKVSCGTQYIENDTEEGEQEKEKKTAHPISFTKYLRDFHELSNVPIYANSLNINISNNYLNGKKVCSAESEEFVGEDEPKDGLPTPDLISNHNSLEQHNTAENETLRTARHLLEILHETVAEIEEHFSSEDIGLVHENECIKGGNASVLLPNSENSEKVAINLPSTFAAEICTQYDYKDEGCFPIPKFLPKTERCDSIDYENLQLNKCVTTREPLVLKSIVKENLYRSQHSSSEEDIKFKADVMDSLEYHMVNKKVKFSEKVSQEKRMFKAMSEFLEEATQLMGKIDRCSNNFLDSNFDIEVTVNDATKARRESRRVKKRPERPRRCIISPSNETRDSSNQTFSPLRSDSSTQYDQNYAVPLNRYEILLEDTCKRLEEKIQRIESAVPRPRSIHEDMFAQEGNHSDLDDSSLESNAVAFSDYGSLPRRTHKRYRRPACSPSAFLKQLTNMRRHIIRSSREDLVNTDNCNH